MNFFKNIFGSQVEDEPLDAQIKAAVSFATMCKMICPDDECLKKACDEIPNAEGLFGYSKTNPIPVNGPEGEIVYLNRLLSASGVPCFFHRTGSTPILNSDGSKQTKAIDVFEVVAMDASQWATLYFLMYFPRRSVKCPEGFSLIPWNSKDGPTDKMERLCCKMSRFGSMSKVEDFPLGLPEAVENSPKLKSVSAGAGAACARVISERLNKRQGQWQRPS